jgi:hypothetical protein
LLKFCVKILFRNHYLKKKKDPELDPDPGGSKTCGSPTLPFRLLATGRPAAGEMVVGGEGGEGDRSGGHRGSTLLRPAASFCNIISYQRKDAAKAEREEKKMRLWTWLHFRDTSQKVRTR